MAKKILRLTSIVFSVFFCLLLFVQSYSFADIDVTDKIELIEGRLRYDRGTKTSYVDISLQNISQGILQTPIKIIIDSITDPSVTLTNPDGITDTGKPYFEYENEAGNLGPGEITGTKNWIFYNPLRKRFNFVIGSILSFETQQNSPPIANAGTDREHTLAPGQTTLEITLDGGVSDDPDGTVSTYTWTGSPDPTDEMQPVLILAAGTYEFSLTVTDNDGAESAPDTVQIIINPPENQRPVAEAGPEQTHTLSYDQTEILVSLNGSGSHDPDGVITDFIWTSESGLPDPENVPEPSVTLTAGTYTFSLVVTDDDGATSLADTVTIIITPAPSVSGPPVISINPLSYTVPEGDSLSIDVLATDPDGDVVTLSASPKLDNAQFTCIPGTQATGTFNFSPDHTQQGMYVIAFKARDPLGLTATKTIQITVTNVNRAPAISAPDAVTVDEGGLLTIPIQTDDPDGDILTLTATPLPENSVFIPATGTITFTPDFNQEGSCSIYCQASDGDLSAGQTVQITVNNVPNEPGGSQELVLNVNEPESPTFLTTAKITGTVNTTSDPPRPHKITSSLITAMNPATGRQGETMDVTLNGQTLGDFATHFQESFTQVGFGEGITINSTIINTESELIANITIAPDAAIGPRCITVITGNENAISIMAFNVYQGRNDLTGTVIDSNTEQPISGAVITIQGTNLTTTTNSDGTFLFTDVPTGDNLLMVNAENHDLMTVTATTSPGLTTILGTLESHPNVFDPTAPASVNLYSIIGRNASDTSGSLSLDDAKQLFIDSWLLVGGDDAGVLDEYGNQLNPNFEGPGKISLTQAGIDGLAKRFITGNTMSLQEILYGLSFGIEWSEEEAPLLTAWLDRLQEMVNESWLNPSDPDSYMALLIFNKGSGLLPEPPTITHDMRLNILQANLFMASFMLYTFDPERVIASAAELPDMPSFISKITPWLSFGTPAYAAPGDPVIDPEPGGRTGTMRRFWSNYFGLWSNVPMGAVAALGGTAFGVATATCVFGGQLGMSISLGILGFVEGICADITMQQMVSLNLMTFVPCAPIANKAEVIRDEFGLLSNIQVSFHRSVSDHNPWNDYQKGINYWYTLYRYNGPPEVSNEKGEAVANFCSNCPEYFELDWPADMIDIGMESLLNKPIIITDPYPLPNHTYYYDLVVTRLTQNEEFAGGDDHLGTTISWKAGALAALGSAVDSTSILGMGMTIAALNPVYSLVHGLKKLTSDHSNAVVAHFGENPSAAVDDIEVDPTTGFVFYSNINEKTLYKQEWKQDTLVEQTLFAHTQFIDPGQMGLAIDSFGNIITINHASEASYGGRLFKFKQPNGSREHCGTVNYFSQVLWFAHPISVSTIAPHPEGSDLYVFDEYRRAIKRVPVNAVYDSNRRNGKDAFGIGDEKSGYAKDMETTPEGIYVLAKTRGFSETEFADSVLFDSFSDGDGSLTGTASLRHDERYSDYKAKGIAVDEHGNIYMSIRHNILADGKILMFPIDSCGIHFDGCKPIEIMTGLLYPGDIELGKDGRALYIIDGENVKKHYFGISGHITDTMGNPLVGAKIFITSSTGTSKSYPVDFNGSYHVKDLFRLSYPSNFITLSVEYFGKRKEYLTYLGQSSFLEDYGHSVRNIEFDPW